MPEYTITDGSTMETIFTTNDIKEYEKVMKMNKIQQKEYAKSKMEANIHMSASELYGVCMRQQEEIQKRKEVLKFVSEQQRTMDEIMKKLNKENKYLRHILNMGNKKMNELREEKEKEIKKLKNKLVTIISQMIVN
jgi:hypothetical protein